MKIQRRVVAAGGLAAAATLSVTVGLPAPAGAQAAPSATPAAEACGVTRPLPRLDAGTVNDLGIAGGTDPSGRPTLGVLGIAIPVGGLDGRTGTVTDVANWLVAAGSVDGDDRDAFRWSLFGGTRLLGEGDGVDQDVAAVNGRTDVLYTQSTGGAFVWQRDGEVRPLATPELGGAVHGMDINDAGWAVGYIQRQTPYYTYATDGLVWGPDGQVTELPSLVTYTDTTVPDNDGMVFPAAVTRDGTVYGTAIDDTNHTVAFRWTAEGGMQVLGRVGDWMRVFDANDRGDLVGTYSINGEDTDRVFTWTEQDGFQDLGVRDLAEVGEIDDRDGPNRFSINNSRQVVGSYRVYGADDTSSFSWTPRRGRCGR